MPESNILMKMTIEKNRLIKEAIVKFLGHEPTKEERKNFNIMHSLNESNIYYKGMWIGDIKNDTTDDSVT